VTQALVLTPLGGLGEIGMNAFVLEQPSASGVERLLIDCGATFPSDDLGVDLIHPRFDALLDVPEALEALVLTHGHEDHVGAIPFLLEALLPKRSRPLRIVGPRYAIELARDRIVDEGIDEAAYRLEAVGVGDTLRLGGFEVEWLRVTHSIVDATALIVRTCAGTVVHSGDFKLEDEPLDGQPTDESRLERAGDEGVALLLSDSTNVFQEGSAGGELGVLRALESLVSSAEARVVVGLFASNVHRLSALEGIARRAGRHLCLLGRSVRKHSELGRRLGWLDWSSDRVVAPEIAATLPKRRVLYLATGTQAEPRAALARLAAGEHPDLQLEQGDRVILSSRVIPGAERAVFDMQDRLLARGVELVTRLTHPAIHVSGHAHRGEQRRLLELVRPRSFVPVHGTLSHLRRHAELATEVGVEDTLVLRNGERAALGSGGLARLSPIVTGRVHRGAGAVLERPVLDGRRDLGRGGIVVALVHRPARGGAPKVEVIAHGLPEAARVDGLVAGAVKGVFTTGATRDEARLVEAVRRAIRHRILVELGQRPVVEVRLVDGAAR
jgi:ribonuclease J